MFRYYLDEREKDSVHDDHYNDHIYNYKFNNFLMINNALEYRAQRNFHAVCL